MERNHTIIQKLPDAPGVYFFVGAKKRVLYIGKATSLADRVRSYFLADIAAMRGAHIAHMVQEAVRVEYRETRSVLEALVLEAELIKSLHPPYNTREKDDKSFNYLVVTTHERYPRLLTVRGKELQATYKALGVVRGTAEIDNEELQEPLPTFGPFPHARQFKEALAIVRKIFPFYDTKRPVAELREKNDKTFRFNESIGRYPSHEMTEKEYAKTIKHLLLFFKGKQTQLEHTLEKEMNAAAKKEYFELANTRKRQLFALQHIQDVSLLTRESGRRTDAASDIRIEAYDVAHLRGAYAVGVMVVLQEGEPQKKEYRTFKIKSVQTGGDVPALQEILSRRLAHSEWEYPRLIVVDGGKQQLQAARKVLQEAGVAVPVVAVTKDEKHRPRSVLGDRRAREKYALDILLANAESHRFAIGRMRKKM